jgi:hypothetical protein
MRAPDKYFSFTIVMIVMVLPLQLPKTLQKQKKLVTKASSGGICGTCFHQLLPSWSNYQLRSKRSLSNCSQWSKAGSNLYKKSLLEATPFFPESCQIDLSGNRSLPLGIPANNHSNFIEKWPNKSEPHYQTSNISSIICQTHLNR